MKNIMTGFIVFSFILGGLLTAPLSVIAEGITLTASITAPTEGQNLTVGQSFTFNGSAAGGNSIFYSYLWNFGDGSFGAGATYDKVYAEVGSKTVTLTVTDHDGTQASVSRNIAVVGVTPPTPTVDLKVNDSNGPITVASGTVATLSWSSTDATSCTGSDSWSGSKATTGSESTGALNLPGAFTYTLTCTGAGGSASDHAVINVSAPNPDAPTVDLKVNDSNGPITVASGTVATLSWAATNATACTASGSWSGSKAINSSESTGALNTPGAFTYTLTCTGAGGSVSDSVTINVQAVVIGAAPVISNVHVTDITQTTAIVHWDTDIPADSRVIYDTVSHPTLGAAPNYGYAFSSDTFNSSPKVTSHAVTLTGLTANTNYFFRVLSQS